MYFTTYIFSLARLEIRINLLNFSLVSLVSMSYSEANRSLDVILASLEHPLLLREFRSGSIRRRLLQDRISFSINCKFCSILSILI